PVLGGGVYPECRTHLVPIGPVRNETRDQQAILRLVQINPVLQQSLWQGARQGAHRAFAEPVPEPPQQPIGQPPRQPQQQLVTGAFDVRVHHATSTVNSTSTGAPSGSSATPTAARACAPASPKISPNTSEAPLMTAG